MHPSFKRADELSRIAIGAAIEVHRIMGPGLLESIYEKCLFRELELQNLRGASQREVRIVYKDVVFVQELRFDLLVENCLLLEIKAVDELHPVHKAQLLSYMKLLDVPIGLLMNFHEMRLVEGVSRLILSGADSET